MNPVDVLRPTVGGLLIGLGAALLFWSNGRTAGISGIVGGLMAAATPPKAKGWRWAFLGGLVATGIVAAQIAPRAYALGPTSSLLTVGLAGLLVGFGTRLGNGCTSGHGVCGISRGSSRSMAATVVFMLFGVVTVYGMKHGWAGAL